MVKLGDFADILKGVNLKKKNGSDIKSITNIPTISE